LINQLAQKNSLLKTEDNWQKILKQCGETEFCNAAFKTDLVSKLCVENTLQYNPNVTSLKMDQKNYISYVKTYKPMCKFWKTTKSNMFLPRKPIMNKFNHKPEK